jgi:subtilisin family serine protease
MPQLSLATKLSVVLGIDLTAAERIAHHQGTLDDLQQVHRQSHFPLDTLLPWLLQPKNLQDYRLNPNQMSPAQLQRLPGLNLDRLPLIRENRPFFSLIEFAQVSQLPLDVLETLLELPNYSWFDKPKGETVAVTPVPGLYSAITQSSDFETVSIDALTGFTGRTLSMGTQQIAVVAPSPSAAPQPTPLKHALTGRICPALRDAAGIVRYVVPLSVDLWFDPATSRDRIDTILTTLNLQITPDQTASLSDLGYIRAQIPGCPIDTDPLRAVLEVIQHAQQYSELRFAEPEQIGPADFPPDNAQLARDSDFESSHQYWNHHAIHLAAAHQLTTGSPHVTVFIVDSGLETEHPALATGLRQDWPAVDLNFAVGLPESALSPHETGVTHGTQVASIVSGQGARLSNSGSESESETHVVRGIAPGCAVLPIKISGSLGYGLRAAAIRQAIALLPAGDRGIINLSWRIQGEHIGIREALIEADRQGFAIVTSAGNYPFGEPQQADKIHYPSAYAHHYPYLKSLCSVGATTASNTRAAYSYFGSSSVTVAAPGGESGQAGIALYAATPIGQHAYVWGTSFAAPHVTGLLALMFSLNRQLSAAAAIDLIKQTAQPLNAIAAQALGSGLIDARAALQAVSLNALPEPATATVGEAAAPAKLNLNTANANQLASLPGMNSWRIDHLLRYRQSQGPLTSAWDLLKTGAFNPWVIYQLMEKVDV